ncbi:MAG: type IVB secretion system protein IcmH/DotU [bacterium]
MEKTNTSNDTSVLSDIFGDLFTLILYLRETEDFGDPRSLHDKIDNLFKSAEAKTKSMGISDDDFLNAKYAISALVDETVLYSKWPQRNEWLKNPLVIEYFNDAFAGEIFFDKIEMLRGDSSKRDVLEIFYMCLMFGFEGKFKILGGEEMKNYMQTIYSELDFKVNEKLSPHTEVPKQIIKIKRLIPRWVMASSYILLALSAIVIFLIFKVKMIGLASNMVAVIKNIGL